MIEKNNEQVTGLRESEGNTKLSMPFICYFKRKNMCTYVHYTLLAKHKLLYCVLTIYSCHNVLL